jgi:hypothetical protein
VRLPRPSWESWSGRATFVPRVAAGHAFYLCRRCRSFRLYGTMPGGKRWIVRIDVLWGQSTNGVQLEHRQHPSRLSECERRRTDNPRDVSMPPRRADRPTDILPGFRDHHAAFSSPPVDTGRSS